MADLSSVANGLNGALSLGNLILVTPQKTIGYQPQNAPSFAKDTSAQPASLLFHYEGEQTVSLQSDITDHYIEDNTAIQDQVALKPVVITTHGFVGELNNVPPAALALLKTAADKLVAIQAYAPQVSETAALAYNTAFQLYQTTANLASSAVQSWASLTGGGLQQTVINGSSTQKDISGQKNASQNTQQIFFTQFYGYWVNRSLFTVQTPWAVFQDMAIQSLRAIQDAETRVITDFEVTFKQMRFASSLSIQNALYDNTSFQGRAGAQGADEIDLGTSTLQKSDVSFGSQVA